MKNQLLNEILIFYSNLQINPQNILSKNEPNSSNYLLDSSEIDFCKDFESLLEKYILKESNENLFEFKFNILKTKINLLYKIIEKEKEKNKSFYFIKNISYTSGFMKELENGFLIVDNQKKYIEKILSY